MRYGSEISAASGCLHSATSAILRTRTWVDGQPVAQKRALRICAPHRLLRATWMAHELLTTFEAEIGGVTLVPGVGGIFDVSIDGAPIWSRAAEGRFPDIKELKQLVRDRVAPGKSLGHSDREPV